MVRERETESRREGGMKKIHRRSIHSAVVCMYCYS